MGSLCRFGGFGSDHCSGNTLESWRDREELVRIAASRARNSAAGVTGQGLGITTG